MKLPVTWILKLWHQLCSWLKGRPQPLKGKRVGDLPEILDPRFVYLVGEGKYRWFAAMICPCGCGVTLHMSLLSESRPRWQAIEHKDGTISLEPSVWRQKGCHSHFFVHRGDIKWC